VTIAQGENIQLCHAITYMSENRRRRQSCS